MAQRKNPIAAKCFLCMKEQLDFDPDHMADQLNEVRRPVGALKDAANDYDSSDDDSDDGLSYDYTSDGVSFFTVQIEGRQADLT